MTIKPPSWCSKAVPTTRGWKHWATSEILLNKQFTQEQIDGFYAAQTGVVTPPTPAALVEAAQPDLIEIDYLEDLSKRQLEALGREHGVELDRRASKKTLISQMADILPSK